MHSRLNDYLGKTWIGKKMKTNRKKTLSPLLPDLFEVWDPEVLAVLILKHGFNPETFISDKSLSNIALLVLELVEEIPFRRSISLLIQRKIKPQNIGICLKK